MWTAETFRTHFVGVVIRMTSRACGIRLVTRMPQRPIRAPHIRACRISDADPRGGQTIPVALADKKRLAGSIDDAFRRNLAVAEEDSIVVAELLEWNPIGTAGPWTP